MLGPLRSALATLQRKLGRSLAQRGIRGTLQRCVSQPLARLYWLARDLTPRQRRHRRSELEFDRRHQIDTRADRDLGWMAKIASPNWVHGVGYAPIPANSGLAVLAGLDIDYQEFTFVDYGAGKGRCLFLAARFPFQRIIGVEYSPTLYDVLLQNIASFRDPQQQCFRLEAVLQDATQFPLPPGPLVLFFHHPFEAPVFRAVVEQITRSLEDSPRPMLAIYYDPHCPEAFDESELFQRVHEGEPHEQIAQSASWIVFQSCPELANR